MAEWDYARKSGGVGGLPGLLLICAVSGGIVLLKNGFIKGGGAEKSTGRGR